MQINELPIEWLNKWGNFFTFMTNQNNSNIHFITQIKMKFRLFAQNMEIFTCSLLNCNAHIVNAIFERSRHFWMADLHKSLQSVSFLATLWNEMDLFVVFFFFHDFSPFLYIIQQNHMKHFEKQFFAFYFLWNKLQNFETLIEICAKQ